MKQPMWTQTLAWAVAVVAALVLALVGPDLAGLHNFLAHDAMVLHPAAH